MVLWIYNGKLPHSGNHSSMEGFGAVNRNIINPRMEIISNGIGAITPVAPGTNTPKRLTTKITVHGIKLTIPKRTASSYL